MQFRETSRPLGISLEVISKSLESKNERKLGFRKLNTNLVNAISLLKDGLRET
jgi:hypothetical protein